jgi:hypothetical protein
MVKALIITLLVAGLLALAGCGGAFYGTVGDWPPDDLSLRPSLRLPLPPPAPARPAA